MKEQEPLHINCDRHGKGVAAVVCGHLAKNVAPPLGFIENSSDPNDLQGWCYACEYLFLQEEDMTEKFRLFNHMTVVCNSCYAEIASRNEI